jgi:hypothetical protein
MKSDSQIREEIILELRWDPHAEVRAILAEAVREPADSARQSSAVHGLSGVGGTSSATVASAPVSRART